MKTQILRDPTFAKGFIVGNAGTFYDADYQIYIPFQNKEPDWVISQWFTSHSLAVERNIAIKRDAYQFGNKSKCVKREADGALTLDIVGEHEYKKPRIYNQGWPHLLVEQKFDHQKIGFAQSLFVDMSVTFLDFVNKMKTGFDPELHTLQLNLSFQLGDRDLKSSTFGDFFWFSIPLVDLPRNEMPKEYAAEDYGKSDATHKMILSMNPRLYMTEPLRVGNTISFNFDVLPEMKKALAAAQGKGYMEHVPFERIELISLRFGFEDTGTFDGKARLNHLLLEEEI